MQPLSKLALIGTLALAACCGVPHSVLAADTPPTATKAAATDLPAWATKPVTSVEGITEFRLPNGLRVLLFPDQASSNVTVNITYFVGSRHEGRGEKGMAHLLEHMVFKGTPTHPDPWKSLQDHGAQFNGTTWTDRTNYYETLVASDENLEFALRLEADRMVNSFIDGEALKKEMTVVRNEFEMGENNPFGLLMKELFAKAYTWHPYRDSTIGNRSDLERVPADNLRRFYKHYYRPANAMLVVAGKFDMGKTLRLIDQNYSKIENPAEAIVDTWTEEPVQDGPRFVEIRREGSQASVGVFYHTPAGSHADSTALQLLGNILSNRPSGRLYKALVEANLAAAVSTLPFAMAERGQMLSVATLKEGQDPAAALAKLQDVMEGFASNPVTDEEVERARSAELSSLKLAMTDSNRIGVELTEYASVGDWRLLFIYRDRVKAIKTAEVQAVATKYFVENNRTGGKFIPTKTPVRAEIPAKPEIGSIVEGYKGQETMSEGETFDPTPANIDARTVRSKIGENVSLAMLSKKTRGEAVNVSMVIRYGDEKSLSGTRVANGMLGGMLRRGTQSRSYQQITDELNKIQSTMNISSQLQGSLRVSITSDKANIAQAVAIAADVLRNPTFPENEFGTMQKEAIAQIEAQLSNPQALAMAMMQRSMSPFPKDSVLYVPSMEERLAETKDAKLDDVKKLYNDQVGPSSVQVAAVGEFDAAALTNELKKAFDGWAVKKPFKRIERPFVANESGAKKINTPDKPMAMVGMATSFKMSENDEDAPALQIASYILGGGAKSRMLDRLRQKEGLSYGAGAGLQANPLDPVSNLFAFAICAKQNAGKAADAMKEEMTRWIESGIDEKELGEAKKSYRLDFMTNLNDDSYIASSMTNGMYLNRTMKWDADRLEKIDALNVQQINDAVKRRMSGLAFVEIQAGDLEPKKPADAQAEPKTESK
jgi:zinc protease